MVSKTFTTKTRNIYILIVYVVRTLKLKRTLIIRGGEGGGGLVVSLWVSLCLVPLCA